MKTIFFVILLGLSCCYGFHIHTEYDDSWIDDNEIYREAKYQKIQWIFPGTKWCGVGNVAENNDDLGTAYETDKCCRQHDFCDDILEAKQSKNNLTNDGFYTKLHCKCDKTFYECLKTTRTKTSKAVGYVYFNVLGTQCYKKEHPIVRCLQYYRENRCAKYELNTAEPKIWQWFDVPEFK